MYLTFFSALSLAQPQSGTKRVRSNPTGKRIFASSCASCHGLDGRGAERGPDISGRREIQRLSDKALLRIVEQGVPGTGMPSFRLLGASGIQAVVLYLRSLQGQSAMVMLPGDPARGKIIFFGKAECSQCHTANGEGGFIASDLSRYATPLQVADIRNAIVDPNKNLDPRKRTIVVTAAEGKTYTGVARNEDNFTLQLQTLDGSFHFFTKSELKSMEYQAGSLMPNDYASRLNKQEIDDVVSYLMSIGRSNGKQRTENEHD
jgi:putative heme-binding domain-containing protein